MAGPVARDIADKFGVDRKRSASILDIFASVGQGLIPYGAQMLVALSAANELGYEVSAFQIMSKLFYPAFLLLSSLVFISVGRESSSVRGGQ